LCFSSFPRQFHFISLARHHDDNQNYFGKLKCYSGKNNIKCAVVLPLGITSIYYMPIHAWNVYPDSPEVCPLLFS